MRLLVHSNEFDIEGIIPQLWLNHSGRHGKITPSSQMDLVRDMIGLYGRVRGNLLKHASDYPDEASLKSVLKRGKTDIPHPDRPPEPAPRSKTGKIAKADQGRLDHRTGLRTFPATESEADQQRWPSFGRRAADADHCTHPNGQPGASAS